MKQSFDGIFEDVKVLITGHTGFKGAWLALWLQELGAEVIGFSLPPSTVPNNFTVSDIGKGMIDIEGDIRDYAHFTQVVNQYQPQILFHLAAQPIVLNSFEFPKETFDVNVGGTVNVLEAIRHCPSVKAAVMVTSDKCYENKSWIWGYRESDPLGGYDPYSVSKSMAEQVIASYRTCFFSNHHSTPAIASVRAGNVIGGGDFSSFRIVPDCMKALMNDEPIKVRNPESTRPWLHILDVLSGYLTLASRLLQEKKSFADAWNFGPIEQKAITVQSLVEKAIEMWGSGSWINLQKADAKPEMDLLRLNWDKAANRLHWRPTYTWSDTLQDTVDWFKAFHQRTHSDKNMRDVCLNHLRRYTEKAIEQKNAGL